MNKRVKNPSRSASMWRQHHQRMKLDDHYARVVVQTLVAAAWQETLPRVAHVGLRGLLELARTRVHRR